MTKGHKGSCTHSISKLAVELAVGVVAMGITIVIVNQHKLGYNMITTIYIYNPFNYGDTHRVVKST